MPRPSPRRPDSRETGARLLLAARLYRSRMATTFVPFGIHPGQEALLRALAANGAMGAGALAALLGVKAPTLSKSVARLQREGLVVRGTDPDNPRAVRIMLTEEGARRLGGIEVALVALDEVVFDGLESRDRKRLRKVLKRLVDRLDDSGSPDDGAEDDNDGDE